MTKEPTGVDSDYRDERWAARAKYVHDNAGDWLGIAFFGGIFLVLVGAMIWSAVVLWTMGHGWPLMLMIALPLVLVGWNYLGKWSRKTLEKAEHRRMGPEREFRFDDF